MVWFDLATQFGKKKKRRLRFHTKLVLFLTAGILLFGTVSTLLIEWNNPGTIGNLSAPEKLLVSFFQTVSMRTAGFASIDYTQARPVTLLIYILQMFLGGAPGGTAGGSRLRPSLSCWSLLVANYWACLMPMLLGGPLNPEPCKNLSVSLLSSC